ncbi:MAG: transcriptional regulator [Acidimicrobiales bacterium]
MGGPDEALEQEETVLQKLIERHNLTREEVVKRLKARASKMKEATFTVSTRQLDRWCAGQVKDEPRPVTRRVLEEEFGLPWDVLLGPADRVSLFDRAPYVAKRERPLNAKLVSFLAGSAGATFEATYELVAAAVEAREALPAVTRAAREHEGRALARGTVAEALQHYYGAPGAPWYRATVKASKGEVLALNLSVRSGPAWTGLSVPLDQGHEQTRLDRSVDDALVVKIPPEAFVLGVDRLAAVEAGESVLVDNPLFRLLQADVDEHHIDLTFGLTTFKAYALGVDLLAAELLGSLARSSGGPPGELLLREHYLPTVDSALAFGDRTCAGGPVCLLAIAREEDYLIVVQERSGKVLNAAGRLAVVPKAFHQPLTEEDETRISATVNRELEEELLGRLELDQISPEARRRLLPGHASALSEPMRSLFEQPGTYQLFCTAFGINLLSGNYEVACLALIEDPAWGASYSQALQANWEVGGTRCYSSLDTDGLFGVISDPRWSDEGLFAFIEGLRLLAKHAPDKVKLPSIEVEL